MTTYPLPTLAPTIDASGITIPSFEDVLLSLQASYQQVYGSDAVLTPDTQDGQWIAIQAKAINDENMAIVATYQNQSPATAQGAGLSINVKINGINRDVPTRSTAPITLTGQAGKGIVNGIVGDNQNLNTQWLMPGTITIPGGGSITVTGTCTTPGAIPASAHTLVNILTPVAGWQASDNPEAATLGAPSENDAQLRARQRISTNLPAQDALSAIAGAVANVTGVQSVKALENDEGTTDLDGLPPHSFAIVVQGGSIQSIVNAIGLKKPPGTQTYGNTSGIYVDAYGIDHAINFSIPQQQTIDTSLTITALDNYQSAIGDEIVNAMTTYINTLTAGDDVLISRLYAPALLSGPSASPASPDDALTYDLNVGTVKAAIHPASPGTVDIGIGFDSIAVAGTVTLTVL